MSFRLNDSEATRLRGLSYMDQVLYVFGLRMHMDYQTGVVGESRRISIQGLQETLYVEPGQGPSRERGAPSKWRILRALDRLQDAGLLERDSDLVFNLPLADKGLVSEKTLRTDSAPTCAPNTAPVSAPKNTNTNNTDTEHYAPDCAPDCAPTKVDIPHHLWSLDSSVSKDTGTSVPSDPSSRLWRLWIELVGDTRANRAILGKAIREHGEDAVAEAVAATYAKAPAEPVSYMRGCLRPKRRFMP